MANTQVYFRVFSPTQSLADMELQIASQELWGKEHQPGGAFPSAKAYVGELPEGKVGFQFTTDVSPSPGCSLPKEHRWRKPEAEDADRDGFVKIPIQIERVVRPEDLA